MDMLPFELVDLIIRVFAHDPIYRCTLKICASVCTMWHAVVRPFIFRSITLRKSSTTEKLKKLVLDSPEIGWCIRRLILVDHIVQSIPHLSAIALPWVTEVNMIEVTLQSSDISMAMQHFSSYRSIRCLHLQGCRFHTVDAMYAILHGFPELRAFSCNVSFELPGLELPPTIPANLQTLPPLTTFKFEFHSSNSNQDYDEILAKVSNNLFRDSIYKYGFAPRTSSDVSHVDRFLHRVESTVTSLDLSHMSVEWSLKAEAHKLALLCSLPSLEEISLPLDSFGFIALSSRTICRTNVTIFQPISRGDSSLKVAADGIMMAYLPKLEHLRFTVWYDRPPGLGRRKDQELWIMEECARVVEGRSVLVDVHHVVRGTHF